MIAIVAASYRRNRNAMKRARVTEQSATRHRWRKDGDPIDAAIWWDVTTYPGDSCAALNRLTSSGPISRSIRPSLCR
jgi:hypothetical protein